MERLSSIGPDLGALVQETVQEETTLDTLSEKEGALTAEDLRGYLKEDAEGFSDEELTAAYERTGKPEGEGTTPAVTPDPAATPAGWDRPWKFYKADGSAVEDISKMTAKELLDHVMGFKADGSDQRRSLDEMVRLVQRIPLDEQRIAGLTRQINTQLTELQRLRESDKKSTEDRALWMWALQDPTGARFQKLQEQFLNAGPPSPAVGRAEAEEAVSYEQQGEAFYEQYISPHLQTMARSFSLDGGVTPPHIVQHLGRELDRRFREIVDAEGAAFQDPQYAIARIRQIVQYDLPNELAAAGYRQTASAPAPVAAPAAITAAPSAETASLKARLANLETELARSKSRNAPGPGAGTTAGVGKGGPDLSKAKSYHEVLDMIRDPNTQWDEE